MEQQTLFIPDNDAEKIETDLVIVGGGPTGLSAGIYAARNGLKSVVLERNILGGQVATIEGETERRLFDSYSM